MRSLIAATMLVPAALLGGCAGFATPAPGTDYGPPPVAYEESIKGSMEQRLKDPESARYRFSQPRKGYVNQGLAYGGKVHFIGYIVRFEINAKNSYGGYTGYKPHMAAVHGGTGGVRGIFEGNDHPLVHEVE